ncbi:PaaI family thioesterase [Baekduia soli]|uniref:PaaI family thioesterase n=1 Tax=Baekduia soli TaxID=496014 RepID=A0A5B8UCY2_9ACTN|nr:PaaI family thioesterase [Baekduia soli]QEC50522.1 PaaI family thioesterase [Baekduia soli]
MKGGPDDHEPYARWLGLRVLGPGQVALTVRPELVNGIGKLLGPVGFALVDFAMGNLVWHDLEPGRGAATVSTAVNYLTSTDHGEVTCTATVDRRGRTLAYTSAEVHTEDGRLMMTGIGTFAIITPPPGRGRR